ncbi:outer membrane beta-barrel family protein [Mesonia maritima]|uniref:Outer membrane protein beta-barrel domain-containing protein n=1 Tax=Mesonia maritima TaxID=1793873 RepID=A0ABU1K2E1_9FLAO|nr:outer membrane beta-barrel family protein [Mesonia maritima]MDR6299763.1 hypothetical protein [Mesonia maritima]
MKGVHFLILSIGFCFSNLAFSQFNVSGKVLDENSRGLSYVNLSLFKESDSSFVDGTVSEDDGSFQFSNIPEDDYTVSLSYMGYKTHELKFTVKDHLVLKDIMLIAKHSRLAEVEIEINQPEIRKENGKLIFEVENTSLSSGNTWNLLKQTPGVIVISDNLLIKNRNATIYINNQKVYLSSSERKQLLESYSAENIKTIEVIENPSAKYDAEDGSIINIITSKVLIPTYKGSIYKNYTQGVYAKYQIGTSHYLRTKKFNFFVNYSVNPQKKFKNDSSYINYFSMDKMLLEKWQTDFNKTENSNAQNAHIIMDYEFDSNNTLSLNNTLLFSPNSDVKNDVKTKVFSNENKLDSLFSTNNFLEKDLLNSSTNLRFEHKFKKEKTLLSLTTHLTYYDEHETQYVETTYLSPNNTLLNQNSFSNRNHQHIQIYAFQLDFETFFGEFEFNSGTKVSRINSNSTLNFFDVNSEAPSFNDINNFNRFDYDETVVAFYGETERKWKKFNLALGLRVENTKRTGVSYTENYNNTRTYTELFPSMETTYKPEKNHSFSLSYHRKIARPRYNSLNPFRYFLNENNYQTGNPNLVASISNNFNLNYSFKNAYFLDVYYRDNGRNASQLVFQNNEKRYLRSIYANVLESNSYGIELFHSRSIKKGWYSQAILSVYHEEETFIALESNNQNVTNQTDGFYASIYNSIQLSKDRTFSADLNFLYISSFIRGSYQIDEMITLSAGLRKTLWKGRGEVSLHLADILNQRSSWLRSNYLNQDNGYFAQPENRYIRLGLTYNLGNFNLSNNKKSINIQEEERLN